MIREDSKLWLFESQLINWGVSKKTIRSGTHRNRYEEVVTWANRPHPKDARVKLIDYDFLPESIKSKLPTRAELVKQCQAKETEMDNNQEAATNLTDLHKEHCQLKDYFFFIDKTNDPAKAEDMKQAAGWLRLLNAHKTPLQTRKINFKSKACLRQAVAERVEKLNLYGFKVSTARTLQVKELAWANAGDDEAKLRTLLHGNFENTNRRIIGAPTGEGAIMLNNGLDMNEWNAKTLGYLFMNPGRANKYDFKNIQRRYLYECQKAGRQPEVKLSAIKNFLTDKEVRMYLQRERHGWAELDKMLPHVNGKRPAYSFSKGGYDGFQVDFTSRINGRQMMLTVVACFDYMSGAITGFDVNLVEDGLMVRNMYRNHLNLCGGRSFIEIESDRFSGNLAKETRSIFEKTCKYITQPTPNDPEGKAPNPKSRYVERLIEEVNRLVQNLPGWKGTNITSPDKNRKPNADYRAGNYVEGLAEGKQLVIDLVNMYNHDTYERKQSRWQVLMANVNPEAPVIAHEYVALLLNQSTTVKVTNGVVAFEHNRRGYEYEFADFDQHVHQMLKGYKVKVFFDETDMSSVDVFGEDDQFIGTLGRLHRINRAKAEQTQEDLAGMGLMIAKRNAAQERISRKALEMEASIYGVDISNLNIEEAYEIILGARDNAGVEQHITPHELFSQALETPAAQQHKQYFEDRLITAHGDMVPVVITKEERKSNEQRVREMARKKFNSNNESPNQ